MIRLRTISLALAVLFGVAMAPQAAEAQLPITFGAHVVSAQSANDVAGNDGDAAFGLGARVGIDPPLLPVSFHVNGDYFFVDCGDQVDCGYQNIGAAANFNFLPLPIFSLYATGGLNIRRVSAEGTILGETFDGSETATGFTLGAGVELNFVAAAYLEVVNEFYSDDNGGNQLVIRLGVGL